uniref:Putative acetyltransferase n=1 Tax=Noccaea caerulescens TaxID=107243 RepID=A0A1J3DJ51_NOCCA
MADVTVISSSIVRPGNIDQSGQTKIHLTPCDLNLLYLDYTQRGLLFRKPDPKTSFISRLKTSLSTVLEIYFPFAGRLVKVDNHEDNTVSFCIDCDVDGSGVKFVHAVAESVSVSDLLQPDGSVPEIFNLFFPMNGVKSIDGVSEPLLALQVTEMKDGVFISFGYNHMVADGASIWGFFRTWSKICFNGQREKIKPLVLRGWFLDGIDFPIHIPVTEAKTATTSREISTKQRVFHFTKKNIYDLKTKVNEEVGSSEQKVSSLQAVSAHMWRSIIRNSDLSNKEDVARCIVAVDLRQRLDPPLEKECFGNVVYNAIATATVGELQDRGLGWAALQISKMLRSLTNEDYRTFAEDWVRNAKIPITFGGESRMAGNSIIVSGSPRFEVYDNDFGWGGPIATRTGRGNSISGKLVLFRGIEDGSIDIHATLFSDVLVKLLADVEFMENVTIT